ncbi:hypothetical protein N657DRAFT_134867 [Parathielavia appendiculata]|uniref:histidine kinase n=1 Tax=Parathielavia appendiculata TaxID=2587402 RepID=A0AAN6TVQ6_9PEZI|nr:hypothetical protein N657DRAFT_134867 [Parathielavia appendiculata]
MKMRIAIREQLAAVVVLAVGTALAIVSIPTWIFVNDFVMDVSRDALSLTASLKAARITSEIKLIQTICQTMSTRLLVQDAFAQFYAKQSFNATDDDVWQAARTDLESALGSTGFPSLLQARLYSRNTTGDPKGLLSITGVGATESGRILLPYTAPDGSPVYLGDPEYGYPPSLFPNVTYIDLGRPNDAVPTTGAFAALVFPGVSLGNGSERTGVLLGPLVVNSTFALISLTIPVRQIGNSAFNLGYMTIVANTRTLVEAQTSDEGLGRTGMVLFVGSTNPWNHFSPAASNTTWTPPLDEFEDQNVEFLLPPVAKYGQTDRHSQRSFDSGHYNKPFQLHQYPAVLHVLTSQISDTNNATSDLSTTNEQGYRVAVGVARPQTPLVSWAIVVEQDEAEAYEPIETLKKILLGCVFGTLGVILLLVVPFAHWSVMPIRRLKEATEASQLPPGYEDDEDDIYDEENPSSGGTASGSGPLSEKGMLARIRRKIRKARKARLRQAIEPSRRHFKIPAKVEEKKHFITDELTELTHTFNEMTEELLQQYTSLDQKVAERTRELEISKKAAEAANESKTLFIANISHELKTPLNGIMGMCAVCMEEEDDLQRIKQSLKTVYKSGDLLLHLLEDLLSFSKNQIGQQVSLEEREFRLGDVRSQILAIFDKQVRESKICFTATFVSTSESADASPSPDMRTSMDKRLPALGPPGVGRLKDMCVWGDQHRILQVIINLVSNSLKFTPPGGKVNLRIRCVGEVEPSGDESRTSSFSKAGSNRPGRSRHRVGSGSTNSATSNKAGHGPISPVKGGTALSINPVDPRATPHVQVRERSPTPPPPGARTYLFEFEVEDTGPGIPEHMQQKIFEPFVQGDLGLSKKYGGTGLGLSICSQLATLMGGNISLKSTPGVGTTFTMQIPLKYIKDRTSSTASSSLASRPPSVGSATEGDNARNPVSRTSVDLQSHQTPPATVLDQQPRLVGLSQPFFATTPNRPLSKEDQMAAIDRAMANKNGQGKLRVLVADDNSTNIEVVSRLLKLEDVYDVTIAKDGQEAYDLVKANMEKNQQFDVIFMDVQMPNLDGLQSTRLIRKMGYSAPIVALTAFSEESNVRECMESGMNEFLSKPIRRPALKQVLAKFATIPEEPETTSSVTRRTTPDKTTPAATPDREETKAPVTDGGEYFAMTNGVHSRPASPDEEAR